MVIVLRMMQQWFFNRVYKLQLVVQNKRRETKTRLLIDIWFENNDINFFFLLYDKFWIYHFSIILIVIGFCCYGNIYFKYDTVWMNCNIQQTVSVLKLVSNALFRLQKQQAGFAGGSRGISERAAQAVFARDTYR